MSNAKKYSTFTEGLIEFTNRYPKEEQEAILSIVLDSYYHLNKQIKRDLMSGVEARLSKLGKSFHLDLQDKRWTEQIQEIIENEEIKNEIAGRTRSAFQI